MIKKILVIIPLLSIIILNNLSASITRAESVDYLIKDIGTLETYSSDPIALNNHGQILASYKLDRSSKSEQYFLRERDGIAHAIPKLYEGMEINWKFLTEEGKVYGTYTSGEDHPILFLWDENNGIVSLGELPGEKINKINNFGQVLIESVEENQGEKTVSYPVIWDNGNIVKLKGLAEELGFESVDSIGLDMNDFGDVVGYSEVEVIYKNSIYGKTKHAVMWVNGQPIDLHKKLPEKCQRYPFSVSEAIAINNLGEIAFATDDGGKFLSKDGTLIQYGIVRQTKMNDNFLFNESSVVNKSCLHNWKKIFSPSLINTELTTTRHYAFKEVSRVVSVNEHGEAILKGRTIYDENHGVFISEVKIE